MKTRHLLLWTVCLVAGALQGCRHPLAIVGEGDIVEAGGSGRGCSLEQYRSGDEACTGNEVSDAYHVNYRAVPRSGWRFVRWEGPCPADSDFQHCRFDISAEGVAWWDENRPDEVIPPTTAVFEPITGETGRLLAGTPVAGVTYETPTQEGVTDLEGRFQYAAGESVRFSIGATVLGEVAGKAQVTPFDLAGSPVITGVQLAQRGWLDPFSEGLYPPVAFQWHDDEPFYQTQNLIYRPDPLHTVTNIAVMLHSLDDDAIPGNGIVISAGIVNLFKGVSLDLRQEWNRFVGEQEENEGPGDYPSLRDKVGQAHKNRLFKTDHGPVKPAVAMQHLYETLGLDARTYASCPETEYPLPDTDTGSDCRFDANGNMTWLRLGPDSSPSFEASYEYDPSGNMTRSERSGQVETWQYDSYGNLNLHETSDSESVSTEHWQYGAFGNVVHYEKDEDGDGTVEEAATWQYGPGGRPASLERSVTGSSQSQAGWEYHPNGKLKRYRFSDSEVGGDGYSWKQIWQFDPGGRLVRWYSEDQYTFDGERDGGFGIQTWQYDVGNNMTRKYYADDGGLQWTAYYEFDSDGRLIQYKRDDNGDAAPDSIERFRYGDNGYVVHYERDDGADGRADYIETWQYDTEGKPVRVEGHDGNGIPVLTKNWQYDAQGYLTRYEFDENADGLPESVQTWQYDSTGNLTRHEIHKQDTEWESGENTVETWQYDSGGGLIRSVYQSDNAYCGENSCQSETQYQATGWGHVFGGPGLPWWLFF